MIKSTVEGYEGIIRNLRDFRYKKAPKLFQSGAEKAAKFLLKQSKKVTPRDTGDLRNSGYYRTTGTGFRTFAYVGYNGDGSAPYAVFVHENLDAWHKPPTGAKYLENPMREYAVTMRDIIRDEMRKAF